jgi:hypothetical protein
MLRRTRISFAVAVAVLVLCGLAAAGCADDDDVATTDDEATATTTAAAPGDGAGGEAESDGFDVAADAFLLSPEGDRVWAYSTGSPPRSQHIPTRTEDGDGPRDVNGQACMFEVDGHLRFIAGEDTDQPDPEAAWGVFDLRGDDIGDLEAVQVGRMLPTYQEAESSNPEQFGCAVLSDGRVVTTDVGEQALGPATGQLMVWFPPYDSHDVAYCKLDVAIATAGQIWVDGDDRVHVTSGRPDTAGVIRYSPPFPTGPDAGGGCGSTDPTGAPMADEVDKEMVLVPGEHGILSPSGVVGTPGGHFYVASVASGVINEYDGDWQFVRTVLEPPEGEVLDEDSFSTGTPMALALGPDGTLYYTDIGIVWAGDRIGPDRDIGSVRRIAFQYDEPQAPEVIADGLAFPDGLAVVVRSDLFVMP